MSTVSKKTPQTLSRKKFPLQLPAEKLYLNSVKAIRERIERRTSNKPLWRSLWISFLLVIVIYYILVSFAAFYIYHKHTTNKFTRFIEHIFPYPAAIIAKQIIPLSRFRLEVAARTTYAQVNKLPVDSHQTDQFVMNQLTNRVLYDKVLSDNGIKITDADIQKSLDENYREVGGADALNQVLSADYGPNYHLADFKLSIREYLAKSVIAHQILTHVHVRQILLGVPENAPAAQVEQVRQKALEVKAKITDLASFISVAKDYSEDVQSRDKGGEVGTTIRGEPASLYSQDFENAIFTLPLDKVSDPVRGRAGWHLIWVDQRGGRVDKSLDQYTNELHQHTSIRIFVGS